MARSSFELRRLEQADALAQRLDAGLRIQQAEDATRVRDEAGIFGFDRPGVDSLRLRDRLRCISGRLNCFGDVQLRGKETGAEPANHSVCAGDGLQVGEGRHGLTLVESSEASLGHKDLESEGPRQITIQPGLGNCAQALPGLPALPGDHRRKASRAPA